MKRKMRFLAGTLALVMVCCYSEMGVLIATQPVLAEVQDSSEIHLYGWYVTEEDIYDLNEMYQEDTHLEWKQAMEFLLERAGNYKKGIYGDGDGWKYNCPGYVLGEDGHMDFDITAGYIYGSFLGDTMSMYLMSADGKTISIAAEKDELMQFIENGKAISQEKREVLDFVRNNLKDSEYINVRINEAGVPYVLLSNDSKSELLENQGIEWKLWNGADDELCLESRERMYEVIKILWENRETLGITKLSTGNNILGVYGLEPEETFTQKMDELNIEKYLYTNARDVGGNETLREITTISELEDLTTFIQVKREDNTNRYWSDEYFTKIKLWMEKMENIYPEYSYENLFTLGYLCNDISCYENFDKELIEFTKELTYTENVKNPFDENDFGDPALLAVKVMLQEYKELYPEKTYETLYHTYIKEINESTVLTQEEKRGRYEWKLLGIQKEMKELKENEKKEVPIPAIVGCMVLVLGVFGMVVVKRKGR